jgi:hypothetical protein
MRKRALMEHKDYKIEALSDLLYEEREKTKALKKDLLFLIKNEGMYSDKLAEQVNSNARLREINKHLREEVKDLKKILGFKKL